MSNASNEVRPTVFTCRRAGVLLHPTSLPGGEELGELGPDAIRFVDFLAESGITVWQVLPLGPTHADLSPYMSPSVHAGNPRMISLQLLQDAGWLEEDDLLVKDDQQKRRRMLSDTRNRFMRIASTEDKQDFAEFCRNHQSWLDDFSLYQALRQLHHGKMWAQWEKEYRHRDPRALKKLMANYRELIDQARFEQYLFFRQWSAIKDYANQRGIYLFGDMPIFVAYDSAEVWAQQEYFDLDAEGRPRTVAGVPPDYFSETGQHWGNPHYRWDVMAEDGYQWWIRRMHTALELFDAVRIDHFRGFQAYWEIPADAALPSEGHWEPGPGDALFDALYTEFSELPLVAEDLGVITPEVEALRDRHHLPGMKILQFAFDGNPENPYLPEHHVQNTVVYTGTHDNDTTLGWYEKLDAQTRRMVDDRLSDYAEFPMPWRLIHAALASPAMLSIVPMQDLLGLGGEARMNTPGRTEHNWDWRFSWNQLGEQLAADVSVLIRQYNRSESSKLQPD